MDRQGVGINRHLGVFMQTYHGWNKFSFEELVEIGVVKSY